MNTKMLAFLSTVTLFAALTIPIRLAGQGQSTAQEGKKEQHRYKLIDVGTLGGPSSSSFFGDAQSLNNRGTVIGQADTSTPDPNYPNFNPYIGSGGPDPFIVHAFEWRDGLLVDLGALPGVNSTSIGWIAQNGAAVGNSENGTIDTLTGWPAAVAVYWKDGHIVSLGTLGGNESLALAINDEGQIAGAAANATPDSFPSPLGAPGYGTQQRAFLWQGGLMQDLGTLGGPDAVALLMNEQSQVAGMSYTSSAPNPSGVPTVDPFLWEKGKMIDVGSFGGTLGSPGWLNNRGEVVGFSNLAGDATQHPFLWTEAEGIEDLGTLGGTFGFATWVNEAGEVVGAATNQGDQALLAFRWRKGVITNLGTVDGDPCSIAFNINSRGQVVGSSTNCQSDSGHAFLWEPGGPMIDLNAFVPPGASLTLTQGDYISDDGEILVTGMLPNGDLRTVLLIPCEGNQTDMLGCLDDTGGPTTAVQSSPAAVTLTSTNVTQSSLTHSELLAVLRARLAHRYRGVGRLNSHIGY